MTKRKNHTRAPARKQRSETFEGHLLSPALVERFNEQWNALEGKGMGARWRTHHALENTLCEFMPSVRSSARFRALADRSHAAEMAIRSLGSWPFGPDQIATTRAGADVLQAMAAELRHCADLAQTLAGGLVAESRGSKLQDWQKHDAELAKLEAVAAMSAPSAEDLRDLALGKAVGLAAAPSGARQGRGEGTH